MGLALSQPPEPVVEVDLLPPRFARPVPALERVAASPFVYGFGAETREQLFSSHVAPLSDGLQLRAALAPDDRVAVTLDSGISRVRRRSGDASAPVSSAPSEAFSVSIDFLPDGARSALKGSASSTLLRTRFASDGDIALAFTGIVPDFGMAMYLLARPLYLVEAQGPGAAEVGQGFAGSPSRYTHDRPLAVRPAPLCAAEIGMRTLPLTLGASLGSASAGLHAGVGASDWAEGEVGRREAALPLKAWAAWRVGPATAGLQLSGVRKRTPPGDAHIFTAAGPPSIDAAVSLSSRQPAFEVSLALDGARREVVAGFMHSLTVRRRVYNPLEEAHVRGVFQYLDLGLELRRPLPAAPTREAAAATRTTLALAAALQLNRGALLKLRAGSRDVAVTLALRSWSDPYATLSASWLYDRASGRAGLGLALSLEHGGAALVYDRAAPGGQVAAPSLQLRAQPQLGARRTAAGVVEARAFAEEGPRAGGAGGGGGGGALRTALDP